MENSNAKQSTTFIMELIDLLGKLFLEVVSKVNLYKVRLTGSSLLNLFLAVLFMLGLATTCWWGVLALLFIGLQTLKLTVCSILLLLLALNLVLLVGSMLVFFLLKKRLQFLNS